MISCLSSSCRRRQTLRAALIAMLALTGCQGSLRTWRRDNPSVRDLVAAPQATDRATHGEGSARDAQDRNRPLQSNAPGRSKAGRPNPYANSQIAERVRYDVSDDVAEVGLEDPSSWDAEERELMAEINQADPKHRALLVQMYQAMRANRLATRAADEDYDAAEVEPAEDVDMAGEDERQTRVASATKPKSSSKRMPANQVIPAGNNGARGNVQTASATRPVLVDELGNPVKPARADAVRMQLSDAADEQWEQSDDDRAGQQAAAQQAATQQQRPRAASKALPAKSTRPQEMKPPAKSRAEHRSIQDPVVDTGYEEQLPHVPRLRGPREDTTAISSRRQTPAYDPDSIDSGEQQFIDHYTDRNAVVPASASVPVAEREEPIIRPSTRSGQRTAKEAGQKSSDKPDPALGAATPGNPSGNGSAGRTAEQEAYEDWHDLLQRTLRALDQEPVDSSTTAQLNYHVKRRALLVLLGQLDQALEPIPGLQAHEQEYFRHSFQALYNSVDLRGNPVLARRWPLVMEDLRKSMVHLGAVSNLEVKNAAFCSHVDGFGSVTRFPSYQFRPNQQLLLYCEVDNFVSEQIKDGYQTTLRGNYEILDANQARVADFILPEETDICKSQRRDYFFAYRIYTPQHIAPGRYQLRLTIEDMKGNKFGQTSLDFQINAQ